MPDLTTETWFDKHSGKEQLYPHLTLNRAVGGWRCAFCKVLFPKIGNSKSIGCTERTGPCTWCGEAPLCAPDCAGVRMALSDPKVHIAGEEE